MNWAHWHLMLIHAPILGAFLTAAGVLLLAWKRDLTITRLVFQFIALIGILTIPAYMTGEPSEPYVESEATSQILQQTPGSTKVLVERHEDAALYAFISTELLAVLSFLGLWMLRKRGDVPANLVRAMILVSGVNIVVISWAANLGGQIHHPEIRGTTLSTSKKGE